MTGDTESVHPSGQRAGIPGPSGHLLLGMAPALRGDMLATMRRGFREYGNLVNFRLGPRWGPRVLKSNVVMVCHPEDVHRVLTDREVFTRETTGFQVVTEIIGTGLLTSEGEVWSRQRRTLQPLFTPRYLTAYRDLMDQESARILEHAAADPTAVVDAHQLMQRYTLRVIGRALFGADIDDAVPALRALIPLSGELMLARSLQPARLPLAWPAPRNNRLRQVRSRLYAIVDRIISRRAAHSVDTGSTDLLSQLQNATDPATGRALSIQEIRDQVLVFLLAGHETTASALTFTLYLLGLHPDVQDEIADAADDGLDQATVREAMRLFPPVYAVSRLAAAGTELGGYDIAVQTPILLSPWVTHRHPEFWPDPDRFDPGRFTGTHDRPRYAYFPFGGGARSCIGEHFSLRESTVLLRALLSTYRIHSLDGHIPLRPLITLRPASAVRVTLSKRR